MLHPLVFRVFEQKRERIQIIWDNTPLIVMILVFPFIMVMIWGALFTILPIALSGLGLLVAYARYGLLDGLPDILKASIGIILAFGYLMLFFIVLNESSWTPNRGRYSKHECIDKKIVNVKPIKEDNIIRYLEITFADGRTFKVLNPSGNIDLTVNSKLILELSKRFHYAIPQSDYWEINQIIKVP